MKTKILLIEDNVKHLSDLIKCFKGAHERYELLITQDGEEACDIAHTEQPDLIITDWELKGSNLNGLQIITELKGNQNTVNIPIIMATQFTSSDMLDKALNAGAVDYIRKPIDKTELLARVRAALLLKRMTRSEIIKEKKPQIKVLFIAANPKDYVHLNLDKEYKAIATNLKRIAQFRDLFDLKLEIALTADSLMQAILEEKPNIIHFSGHGQDEGIILEDESGRTKLISTDALESLFALFSDSIDCVILNSCYSKSQAEAISKHIPYTIGMKSAIKDAASLAFSLGFYKALGAGEDIEMAYKFGIVSIKLEGVEGDNLPLLLTLDTIDVKSSKSH